MISVEQYRQQGHSEEKVRLYALKRNLWKRKLGVGNNEKAFNVFTNDPNCKTCGKMKNAK